jgi:hypothetical protein
MMLVFLPVLKMHMSWIPFISKSRNGINSPVKVNTEFGILKPGGFFIVIGERHPIFGVSCRFFFSGRIAPSHQK